MCATPRPDPHDGFLRFVKPQLAQAAQRIDDGTRALAGSSAELPFDPGGVADLVIPQIQNELAQIITPTLVLELNLARQAGMLRGDSPEARFDHFVETLERPETRLALLERYPVLGVKIQTFLRQATDAVVELLTRLATDWPALRETLAAGWSDAHLARLELGRGDRHHGGRSVCVLHFGAGRRLVYKPRPLGVDRHFQQLLDWLDTRGFEPALARLELLDRGEHGWVGYVTPRACASEAEVERFYTRIGALLALLHGLLAVDMHFENVIAAGEHPVVVDLETLFHPQPETELESARELQRLALTSSCLHVGILPKRYWTSDGRRGVELSGIGAPEGQPDVLPARIWRDAGTDTMRAGYVAGKLRGASNRPSLRGEPVDAGRYLAAIEAGFERAYRFLVAHRGELLADAGPLAAFAADTTRFLLRPTRGYDILLDKSRHPVYLRSHHDQDQHFARLHERELSEHLLDRDRGERLIEAEIADLETGCIPIFVGRPGSRDLWTSGGERLADYFASPPLEQAFERLRRLDDDDLERQLWLVRASFVELDDAPQQRPTAARASEPPARYERAAMLALARAAGDQLARLATRGAGRAVWLGPTSEDGARFSLAHLGLDLYRGLPGIVYFLAYLGEVTREPRYTELAREGLTAMLDIFEQQRAAAPGNPEVVDWIGAFRGWGGVLYVLAHLAALWDDADLAGLACEIAAMAETLVELDEGGDVVFGSAGCAVAALSLEAEASESVHHGLWRACGARLLARLEAGTLPATKGFAEGLTGVAWALARLYAASGEERYAEAARRVWVLERTAHPNGGAAAPCSWHHGAVGAGLARLDAAGRGGDAQLREEVEGAVDAVLCGETPDHSLGWGALGGCELLRRAGEQLEHPAWSQAAERVAGRVLTEVRTSGWRCADLHGLVSPGLLTGVAGIGLGALRVAEPARVPSILLLEPPRRQPGREHSPHGRGARG